MSCPIWIAAGLLAGALLPWTGTALAQSCTATASPIDFGNVSPIRTRTIDTVGTINVTCTWPSFSFTPNARVCLNLGNGTASTSFVPRYLAQGSHLMAFNLYRDAARTQIWGSINSTAAPQPISLLLSKPFAGTTASTSVTYYGRIQSSQPGVPIVGGIPTVYSTEFSGSHATLNVHFYELFDRSCAAIPTASSTYPFSARATVVDDCIVSATDLDFLSTGVLDKALVAVGGLTVRCTNGNAWRISLGSGNSGSLSARRMQRVGGGGAVSYQLYTDSLRSTIWGDGTAGTARVTGTGTGQDQAVAVYGTVPAQPTPAPGTYRDAVVATITF
jgi:spore coat protein U-like protein